MLEVILVLSVGRASHIDSLLDLLVSKWLRLLFGDCRLLGPFLKLVGKLSLISFALLLILYPYPTHLHLLLALLVGLLNLFFFLAALVKFSISYFLLQVSGFRICLIYEWLKVELAEKDQWECGLRLRLPQVCNRHFVI